MFRLCKMLYVLVFYFVCVVQLAWADSNVDGAIDRARNLNEIEDFLVENKRLVEGMEHTPTDIRYATNLWIAEQVFLDRMGEVEKETGALGYIGDWTDRFVFRQIPIGVFEDLTRRSERKGKDIMQAALTMGPKEFRAYIEKYADEVGEEGFFSSDNWYAYAAALEEATNAGYDPTAGIKQFLAALTLASLSGVCVASFRFWMRRSKRELKSLLLWALGVGGAVSIAGHIGVPAIEVAWLNSGKLAVSFLSPILVGSIVSIWGWLLWCVWKLLSIGVRRIAYWYSQLADD